MKLYSAKSYFCHCLRQISSVSPIKAEIGYCNHVRSVINSATHADTIVFVGTRVTEIVFEHVFT